MPTSRAIAAAQSAPCATPSVKDAAARSVTPVAVLPASPVTDRRSPGSSRLAIVKSQICARRTSPYAHAKTSASSPNACGTASAATRNAAIAANIAIRTAPSSGSTTLVNHA
jgi:hypothetical protein